MQVKNIYTNPIHGIKPGEVGELPKDKEKKLKTYEGLGMLEVVKATKTAPKKEDKKEE